MVADEDFCHPRGVHGGKLFKAGHGYRLQLAEQLDLRGPPGRKNQIADFVGDGQHALEYASQI